ncbi:MAG: hypothetical protein ACUVR0_01065 [Candidatus Aminicenantales bacterium]
MQLASSESQFGREELITVAWEKLNSCPADRGQMVKRPSQLKEKGQADYVAAGKALLEGTQASLASFRKAL